jgi:hypothetical protein
MNAPFVSCAFPSEISLAAPFLHVQRKVSIREYMELTTGCLVWLMYM